MLKMVDGTGIIGVDMVCPLGVTVSPPQPPNYDNVEMEGVGSLMLPNSLKAPIERLELIGNSVQLTTTGKNLFDPKQLQGISGFTIEGNEITQSGYNASTGKTLKQLCPEIIPGTYFLSTSNSEFSGLFGLTKPFYKNNAIEITEEDLNRIVSLVGAPNKTIKFTLQLERGDKATPYEPYTGGKPSPSPEYPQEIKNAGRKSKNLFDINYFKDKSNLKMLQCEGFTLLGIICNVKPNTEYTLSANLSEAKYNLNIANKATRFSLTSSPTRTLISNDDGTLYIGFYGATADNVNMDDFMQQYQNIQLEERTVATDYEPYGHFLEMKITGKNLFNAEKAKDANNWTSSAILPSYKEFSIYVGKGNSVNISYLENLETGLGFYANIAHSKNDYTMYWLYYSDSEINITKNKNFIAMNDYIVLRVDAGSVPKFFEYIKTLQIEIGSKQTPYEPYTEQSVQIALDEPLRGIEDYKDVLTKDGVVRKIAPYEVNLNDLRDGGYSKTNTVMFSVKVQNKTVGYASSKPSILCNILPDCALQMSNIYNNDKECIAVGGGIVLFRVNKSRLKDISSFEATKQSFIELMADKKMIVEYALETPVTEPLPESAQQQLQALHSENGTTHVFVDSGEVPCGIKLTYRKEK